jgi:hypothetical protein
MRRMRGETREGKGSDSEKEEGRTKKKKMDGL